MKEMKEQAKGQVGARLREIRERRGIGLREFAAQVGIEHTALSKMERGHQHVPADILFAAAKALMVDPGDFFKPMGNEATDESFSAKAGRMLIRSWTHLPPEDREFIDALIDERRRQANDRLDQE